MLEQALGLRASLPPGRQNGLANILRTVQALVVEETQATTQQQPQQQGEQQQEEEELAQERRRRAAVLPAVEAFSSTDVAVLLSGGVDSSVALSLLQKQASR